MKLHSLAPLALILASMTASAEGFYVLGEVTHSSNSLKSSTFDNQLTAAGAAGLSSSDTGGSNQWRLQGGYRFSTNLAVEAGFIDFGKAKYSATYGGGTAQGTLKASGVDVAAVLSAPLTDNFSVFGKAGIVAARVKSTLVADALPVNSSSSSNVVRPLFGLGASYKLTQNLDLRADFDHVSGLGKNATGKINDNMVSLGIGYNF